MERFKSNDLSGIEKSYERLANWNISVLKAREFLSKTANLNLFGTLIS